VVQAEPVEVQVAPMAGQVVQAVPVEVQVAGQVVQAVPVEAPVAVQVAPVAVQVAPVAEVAPVAGLNYGRSGYGAKSAGRRSIQKCFPIMGEGTGSSAQADLLITSPDPRVVSRKRTLTLTSLRVCLRNVMSSALRAASAISDGPSKCLA
jgi:hypothetical protein